MGRKYYRRSSLDHEDEEYNLENSQDLEKHNDTRESSIDYDDDGSPSSYISSSRETSGSHQPMLHTLSPMRRKGFYCYRLPSRVVRYLCLALMSTMIIFILSLVRASWLSSRQLELGPVNQTPKPAQWESFDFLTRYYGGIRTLVPKDRNTPEYPKDLEIEPDQSSNTSILVRQTSHLPKSIPFDPYPDYESLDYTLEYGEKHECFLDSEESVRIPRVHYYPGVPQGLPDAIMGSSDILGLRDDICFERFGRFGPYGYGYSTRKGGIGAGLEGDREGVNHMWTGPENIPEVDYSNIKWGNVQDNCAFKNRIRFKPLTISQSDVFQSMDVKQGPLPFKDDRNIAFKKDATPADTAATNGTGSELPTAKTIPVLLPRTAVLIRTWWDFEYSQEDIMYLRSIIAELSLLSGGEYTVHFLIHVRDDNIPIWADQKIYQRIVDNALPEEFRGMGTLWSERQMGLIYGGLKESFFRHLPVHGVYRSTYMPVQYFAHQNPGYDYFWNWEMDIRYTGHWYHLFDRVRRWTREQPRKGLWERNSRFYVPSVHGSWEDFKQMIRVQTEMGTESPNNLWSGLKAGTTSIPGSPQGKSDKPIWGPHGPLDMLRAQGDPTPPTTYEKDKYTWGVGEEADLITFNPLFDPDGTTWLLSEDVTGYNTSEGLPPRRTAIITAARLSRRLLETMHRETALKRHTMFSEMWPASCALHHGLKAVYAPHPEFIDRNWPPAYLAAVMNGGRNGATGGARTSVFGDREHNFRGTSWYYNAGFPQNLWRRWLGFRVSNDGGEEEEMAREGRMCLPGVLLHPVKDVNLIIEGVRVSGG
ncbi:hypothetical protein MMC12_003205 [Toensbergia leucococca]|nr:hypothetical protein [Toensbergia leucococca]